MEAEQAELAKLASELAAEKAKVVQLEGKVAKLNADVERVSQGAEAARIALTTAESQAALECQAELALASGTQFLDSLRALLGRPVPAPSLIECSAAAGGQDPQELAGNRTARADFLCIEELDSEEQALVQCVISRLIEEKKPGANSGRTLCSITTKIFGMSQRELDHLVDAYNTFDLCPPASAGAADADRAGADAAAGDPGDTHSAAGAHYMPEVEPEAPSQPGDTHSAAEALYMPAMGPEAPSQPEPDDAVESPPDSVAVYCEVCVIWLNGPKQYESHSIGRKHRKRERDRSRAKSPVPLAPADDAPSNGKVFQ